MKNWSFDLVKSTEKWRYREPLILKNCVAPRLPQNSAANWAAITPSRIEAVIFFQFFGVFFLVVVGRNSGGVNLFCATCHNNFPAKVNCLLVGFHMDPTCKIGRICWSSKGFPNLSSLGKGNPADATDQQSKRRIRDDPPLWFATAEYLSEDPWKGRSQQTTLMDI